MSYTPKILMVDDDARLCDSLKVLLSNQGYRMQTCNSGKEAVEYLVKNDFDLVLLDIVMPEMDGHQIMDYINSKRPETVVIVITGYASMESAIESLRRGAYDYLRKPFEPEELFTTVKNALNKKRLERENKAIQGKLALTEKRYRYLVDNSPDIVYILDHEGRFTFVNDAIEPLLGFEANQLIGNHYTSIVFEEDIDKARYNFNERRTGKRATVSTELRLKFYHNGDELKPSERKHLAVELKAMGMYDRPADSKDKKFTGTYGVGRDISARRQAEEALKRSEEKYRTLFEDSRDAVYITTREGKFIEANQSFLDLFGYSREEMIDLKAQEAYVNPDDRSRFQKEIEQKGSLRDFEVKLRRKDGAEMDCLISATVRRADDGSILGYQGIIRDITEKKRLEAQFQAAQRMEAIGTLAGGLAHDFNNILMGIQGNTSLILLNKTSTHPDYERLKNIEQGAKTGAELTRQLLGFARGGKYEVKPTDLNELIERTSDMFGRTKKEIAIHTKYQKDIWAVEVDQGQIEQVLLNLYVNAWQAMPGGGDLYIETENVTLDEDYVKPFDVEPGRYVKISVTDTGVGMDEATKQRIFEPFFTTREMGRGTGLGLASVYGIIRNHGGIINVYSEKGKGTTFEIYLPVSQRELIKEKELPEELLKGTETILLVDDEDMIIDVCGKILKVLGYKILIARSGKETIELYKANRDKIDMVILDMIMPGVGGGETYDRIKEIKPDIKVLLSSGYSINGQAEEILDRGCDGFIQKPFNMRQFSQKIREILDS